MTLANEDGRATGLAVSPGSASASFVRMFKPRFAALVETGEKLQTIRPTPKRMPKPGDRISLRCWVGAPYRSKQRVLREATISAVQRCEISGQGNVYVGGEPAPKGFAKADGFRSHCEMVNWFRDQHGLPFAGVLIRWQNTQASERPRTTTEHER